jgi:drug/metabolite transporter (DMT)-like permease
MTKENQLLPVLGLGVLTLIWSYNWIVMKMAMDLCGPFSFAALRALIACCVLFMFAAVSGRSLALGSFAGVLFLAVFQTTAFFGFSIWSLVSGGAGKTAVLVYTMPFWIMVLAWPVLGERIRGLQWLAVLFAFVGLVCLFNPWQVHFQFKSSILACLAGFSWALAGVWNKYFRLRVQVDIIALNAWQLLLGAIPLFLIAVFFESHPIRWTPYLIAALGYNAILVTSIGWTLWFFALQKMPAGIAGLSTLAIPGLSVLAAWLQLGEVPMLWEAVGMGLIFLGLTILSAIGIVKGRKVN